MRRLLLLRHAKSSWTDPGTPDHDRPLNDRGRAAAPRVGRYLREEGLVPHLVLCSSARRTCETVDRLGLPDTVDLVVEPDLYLARPQTVIEVIRGVDDAVSTLMVVGHNPTMHELALHVAGRAAGREEGPDAQDAIRRLSIKFPTGALAVLDLSGRWAELDRGTGTLARFVTPRQIDE